MAVRARARAMVHWFIGNKAAWEFYGRFPLAPKPPLWQDCLGPGKFDIREDSKRGHWPRRQIETREIRADWVQGRDGMWRPCVRSWLGARDPQPSWCHAEHGCKKETHPGVSGTLTHGGRNGANLAPRFQVSQGQRRPQGQAHRGATRSSDLSGLGEEGTLRTRVLCNQCGRVIEEQRASWRHGRTGIMVFEVSSEASVFFFLGAMVTW